MRLRNFLFLSFLILPHLIWAVNCSAGLRLQRTWELYWENGFEGRCQVDSSKGWTVGLAAISSRLGSAFHSNALEQESYWLWGGYSFRPHASIQPYSDFGVGFFWLDIENPQLFGDLPHSAILLTLEGGISSHWRTWSLRSGLGYHLKTGNGKSGPGSLFPLFMHLGLEKNFSW